MGCNCKKKIENIQNYTDEPVLEKTNWYESIISFILRTLVIFLVFIASLIILPFFLIYIFINTLLGRTTTFKLDKLLKKK